MRWRNTEIPTFAGSDGTATTGPDIVERMELLDHNDNVAASFNKAVDGSMSLEVDGEEVGAADPVEVEGPMNAQDSIWNVSIVNTAESGTFTILVTVDQDAPVETAAIDFDATADEVRDAIRTALGAVDACSGSLGPLPSAVTLQFGGSTVQHAPVTLELGSNDLVGDFPTPQFNQSQPGTAGVMGYGLGQIVYDSDEETLFWNQEDGSNPDWVPVGTVYDQYPNSLALLNNLSANGLITPRLSAGGSGVSTDEYNVVGQDATAGAALIAAATDPSAGAGFSPNQIRGTLYLRNPDDGDATPGSAWLKRQSTDQAAWDRVVTCHVDVAAPTANDDIADGYQVGTMWVDTVLDDAFICVDNTATAAVWKKTTP